MNMSRLLSALAVLLLLPATARAEGGCEQWIAPALAEGPITFGFQSADVATGRRACPRTEVGFGMQGGAIIETANFYGAITAAGLLSGSFAVRPDLEVFATLEALRFQFVQNATLTGTTMHLGQLTIGRHVPGADAWVPGALAQRALAAPHVLRQSEDAHARR